MKRLFAVITLTTLTTLATAGIADVSSYWAYVGSCRSLAQAAQITTQQHRELASILTPRDQQQLGEVGNAVFKELMRWRAPDNATTLIMLQAQDATRQRALSASGREVIAEFFACQQQLFRR